MKKIILTSTGFENKKIQEKFMELVAKNSNIIKALFITTAAVEPDAILVLPKCLNDLLNCGILKENITIYDMHKPLELETLKKYDVIYVCGGDTSYLVDRINEIDFKNLLDQYLDFGGIYIGVSAGSIAASGTYKNGLNLLKNELDVHCESGSKEEDLQTNKMIYLTDTQALLITDNNIKLIE